MEFEIFIKDNAFLPNSVDIKTGTNVVFMNEDRVKHNIHCKGHANFPILSIEIGGSEQYYFAVPGRYEISENGIGDMKVSHFWFYHLTLCLTHLENTTVRCGGDRN